MDALLVLERHIFPCCEAWRQARSSKRVLEDGNESVAYGVIQLLCKAWLPPELGTFEIVPM